MLSYLTAGESHGPAITAILEGLPAAVPVELARIDADLARRQKGYGRGGRMSIERDRVEITAGVRHGRTLGSPIALQIRNRDWDNWQQEMSPEAQPAGWMSSREVRMPRPGHADLAGAARYGHRDMRNVLERASARETAARVAVGAVCRCLLDAVGVRVVSAVTRIGDAAWAPPADWDEKLIAAAEASDVSCPDDATAVRMRAVIDAAAAAGDTVGGIIEVRAYGLPPGIGTHVRAERRLDGRLAGALMSVQAIKGVEIGAGFAVAALSGSRVHDPILPATGAWPFSRPTNNAGGIEGGMTNGEPVIVRAAMKPIPTLVTPLPSVSLDGLVPTDAHHERSDTCAVPAAAVVGEAVVCIELARALLETFGATHLANLTAAIDHHLLAFSRLWTNGELA